MLQKIDNIVYKYLDKEYLDTIEGLDIDYDPSKPTIVIADDFSSIISLFKKLMKRAKLIDKFNIIYLEGTLAPVILLKTLLKYPEIKIDIIITDITFGLMGIDKDKHKKFIDGIFITKILKEYNDDMVYLFVTGHIINKSSTHEYYDEYKEFSNDELLDHVVYKDTPISTNLSLIENLFKGTEFEKYIK